MLSKTLMQAAAGNVGGGGAAVYYLGYSHITTNYAISHDGAIDASGNVYQYVYTNGTPGGSQNSLYKLDSSPSITAQVYRSNLSESSDSTSSYTDSSGNSMIAARASAGGVHLTKLDSSLTWQWGRVVNSPNTATYVRGITTDSSGNMYPIIQTATGGNRCNTLKYNSAGTLQWQRRYSTSTANVGSAAVVDSSGNVYVAGTISNTNFMLLKYNSSGALQWQKYVNSGYTDRAAGIGLDSSGNVYIGGTGELGGIMVSKFNSSGTHQWTKTVGAGTAGAAVELYMNTLAVDAAGNSYAVAYSSTVGTTGNQATLIVKFDTNGTLQWQRALGVTNTSAPNYITNSIRHYDNSLYLFGYGRIENDSVTRATVCRIPDDGSLTGNYGYWRYEATSFSAATPGGLATGDLTETDSAGSLPDAAATTSVTSMTSATLTTQTL